MSDGVIHLEYDGQLTGTTTQNYHFIIEGTQEEMCGFNAYIKTPGNPNRALVEWDLGNYEGDLFLNKKKRKK